MNCTYVFNKMIGPFCDPYIRGIASKGGTRSSKTWSVLQLLYLVANESTEPLMISCVTDTLPAVKPDTTSRTCCWMRGCGTTTPSTNPT